MIDRAYRGEADYLGMMSLLSDIYDIVRGPVCCTTGELDWWQFQEADPDTEIAAARLWESSDGKIVAYAWPGGDEVDVAVHPDYAWLLDDVLTWSEAWRQATDLGATERLILRSSVASTDLHAVGVYRERSYQPTTRRRHWRLRQLDADLPDSSLADQYTIGEIRNTSELEQRAALTQHPFTTHLPRAIGYRSALDLTARAPDGSPAAFCVAWLDERNALGILEPVECLPRHRRRGLARALMVEALRRLQALSANSAMITNHATNIAAAALYESLGFETRGELLTWERELTRG